MNSKTKRIISGVVCAAIGACAMGLYKDISYISMYNDSTDEKFIKKLSTINSALEDNYIYETNKEDMLDGAIKGYVDGLDEAYTKYYTKDEFEHYTSSLEDSYIGIGVVISPSDENFIQVLSAIEGSNAYEAGIKPGDIIYKIDGEEFYGDTMNGAVSKIKSGKEGESVNLTIIRDGKEISMDIVRGVVSMKSVTSKMLDNEIGYLRISSFNTEGDNSDENTYTEFCKHMEKLKNSNMKKLIIDLRDNPGGALEIVVDIADYLLPEGLITYIEYKDGTRDEHKSDKNQLDMPITVLVNGNSASASEVLTGALKDYKKATIIGTTTYGKGVVQTIMPFADGSGMSMTIAKYYSPNGVCIHGTGIEPDIKVELDEKYKHYYASEVPFNDDLQLQKAIEVLSK